MRFILSFSLLAAFLPAFPQVNLQSGLVACYSFSGNANDGSGHSYHGTVNGATLTPDRTGVLNSAYTFDGIDDYIAIPAQYFTTANYSYSVWVKFPSLPGYGETGNIFSIGAQNDSQHQTVNVSNSYGSASFTGITVGGYNNGTPATTGVQTALLPFTGRWYHIVSVRTSTEMRMYVDGKYISTSSTNSLAPDYGSPVRAYFGMRSNQTQYFTGTVDDVAIYNRAITADEVTELYLNGLPCSQTPPASIDLQRGLLACYAFNGNADDGSGNNYHGTLHGPTLSPDRNGVANAAFKFNGSNSYIELPPTPIIANQNYTYALWVNPTVNPTYGSSATLISVGQSSGKHLGITLTNHYATADFVGWTAGGSNETGANPVSQSATSGSVPPANQWYHVVSTRDKDFLTLYVNGVLISSDPANNTRPLYYDPATYTVTLGMRASLIQPLNGLLDDVAIYDRALSAAEVQQLYTVGLPCSNPVVNVSDKSQCGGGVFTFTATGGAAYNWYDAPSGGNLLITGDTYTTPSLTQTTSYYVTGTLGGVTTSRKKVTATVWPLPQITCPADVHVDPAVSHTYAINAYGGTGQLQYTYNFGNQDVQHTTAVAATYAYPDEGTFTLTVEAKDTYACTSACMTNIQVGGGPPPDLQRGLLACYAFNGNADDGSGNNYHGALHGATSAPDRNGTPNAAYKFNGSTNYIELPAAPFITNPDYTYAMWVNTSINPGYNDSGTLISVGQPATKKHLGITLCNNFASAAYLGWTAGGWNETGANPNVVSATSGSLPPTNRWYHIVSTRDKDWLALYVNGVLVSSMAANNTRPLYYDPETYTVTLGIRASLYQPYNGLIDDVALYNRALSAAEVQQLYTAGSPCANPSVSVNDQGQCGGGIYTFKATGGAVYDWYDAPTGGNLLYTGDTYTTSPLTQTTSFYVSGTLNGITSPRKKVTATVWPIPELMCDFVDKVYTGDDHSFALKTSAGTPPYTYTFDFGDQTIIDTQAADTIHHYLSTGTFHVNAQVKDAKGCVAACGGYVVAAAEDVLIPNVITPDNGDPLNPIFTLFIKENDVYNIYKGPKPFSLQIMNRWGKEIFHTGDAKAGWHGLGEASGTYYYNINFGDRKFKGWVQVIK